MIIEITKFDMFSFENTEHIRVMENLLLGFGEGKHIVLASKKFFYSIVESSVFGQNTKLFAQSAAQAQIEYNDLLSHVSFHLELDFSLEVNVFRWVTSGNFEKIIVSPDFFHDSKAIQKINIVCENPIDADFYHIIGVYYSKTISSQMRCPLVFEAINGGGGTTKNIFDRRVALRELTLCIIDNDRKHPRSAKGDTCRAFGQENYVETGRVKIIDAHEAESLIPFQTINEVVRKDGASPQKEKSLDALEEMILLDDSTKLYFDHKNGINLNKAFSLDDKYGDYWIPIFRRSSIAREEVCISDSNCECEPPCLYIEGYGENLLANSLEHIRHGNIHNYKPHLTSTLKEQWLDIGKLFFSWCCAPTKRTRV
ncbi:hypothetical protein ABN057_18280 [Providencia alcalifaciens]|uniref:hypothetical protein n=1 Tax=Providencia alcalifaciens TaxID=126385 RepID=UPI0032D9BC80